MSVVRRRGRAVAGIGRTGLQPSPPLVVAVALLCVLATLLAVMLTRARSDRPGTEQTGTTLRWTNLPEAAYYNVQIFRGTQKIFEFWPAEAHVTIPSRFDDAGRSTALMPGRYRWYVWPGIGSRSNARYGPLLKRGSFVIAGREEQ